MTDTTELIGETNPKYYQHQYEKYIRWNTIKNKIWLKIHKYNHSLIQA